MADTARQLQPLQCMEIWGGNAEIDNGVSLAGLDCWVYSCPYIADADALRVGGDIHYVTSCATGRITRLVVADVSGHGAPVAEMAVSLRRLMRKHSNHYDQRRFVGEVNRRFSELTDADAAAVSSLFATAVFATYYAPTDDFSLCNAGHPRPLRFDAHRRVWHAIELGDHESPVGEKHAGSRAPNGAANLPLGVIDDARYDEQVFRLGRDDLVLIYTDSLLEVRGAGGKMLGEQGLIDVCARIDPTVPDRFIPSLLSELRNYAHGTGSQPNPTAAHGRSTEFDDDLTVLLLKRNALKPRVSPLAGVRAAFNIARGLAQSLRPGGLPASIPDLGVTAVLGSAFKRFNSKPSKH